MQIIIFSSSDSCHSLLLPINISAVSKHLQNLPNFSVITQNCFYTWILLQQTQSLPTSYVLEVEKNIKVPKFSFQARGSPPFAHSQRNVADFIPELPFPWWDPLLGGWSREGQGVWEGLGMLLVLPGIMPWQLLVPGCNSPLMWKIFPGISKQTSPRAALKSWLIETQPSHNIQLIILVRPGGCVHTSITWRAGREFRFPSDCENRGNGGAERGFQWFWCQIRADFIKSRSSELL